MSWITNESTKWIIVVNHVTIINKRKGNLRANYAILIICKGECTNVGVQDKLSFLGWVRVDWVGLVEFELIIVVWFRLVTEIKTANQTNSSGSVKKGPNSSKSNIVFAIFDLDWMDLRFFFWIGLVLNTLKSYVAAVMWIHIWSIFYLLLSLILK